MAQVFAALTTFAPSLHAQTLSPDLPVQTFIPSVQIFQQNQQNLGSFNSKISETSRVDRHKKYFV